VASSSSLAAQEDPVLRQLRQHGDHPAIERYCRQELKTASSLDRRAELIAELVGSLAQQANAATDAARTDALWKEADQLLADFIKANPKHSRALLLQRQQVIYAFAHGEQLRQQAGLGTKPPEMDAARAELQRAEELAVVLDKSVRQELEAYNAKSSRLPFAQLTSLSNDVPYRLAQIRLSLAQTHEAKSPSRVTLLEAAAKGFDLYTREGYSDDEVIIRAHLGLAECRRLQKDYEGARKVLLLVEQSKSASAALKDEALALQMQTLMDQDQPAAALALLRGRQKLSGNLALEQVRALLAQGQQEHKRGDKRSAGNLQKAAFDAVSVGEREHGAAWLARADGALILLALPELLDDLSAALRLARACESLERHEKAVAAYTRAAELARAAGQVDQAFELDLAAGRLLIATGQHQAAYERLRRLSHNAPSTEKAAKASSTGTLALLHELQKAPGESVENTLSKALEEHLQRFPDDPTAADAHFLLAALLAGRGQYEDSLRHYMTMPVGHPHFGDALAETVGIVDLLRSRADSAEQRRWTQRGLEQLDRFAREAQAKSLLDAVQPALQIARAALLTWPGATAAELQEADRLIVQAKRPQGLAEWERNLSRSIRVLCLAGQGHGQEALRVVRDELDLADCRQLIDRVRTWLATAPAERRRDFASVLLLLVERVSPRIPGDSEDYRRLVQYEAWALGHLGQGEAARRKFTELRLQAPRDAALATDHARLLMLLATEKDFTEAGGLWQMLAATHQEGTEPWFEAKLQLATCYGKLGQKERALKVVKLTYDLWLADPEADAVRKAYQGRFKELERGLSR
jgi:TolA-binding protein